MPIFLQLFDIVFLLLVSPRAHTQCFFLSSCALCPFVFMVWAFLWTAPFNRPGSQINKTFSILHFFFFFVLNSFLLFGLHKKMFSFCVYNIFLPFDHAPTRLCVYEFVLWIVFFLKRTIGLWALAFIFVFQTFIFKGFLLCNGINRRI